MAREVTFNITEVTVVSGRKKNIKVNVDGVDIYIPVDEDVYTYFQEQFSRQQPTQLQRKKFATIMNLLRVAYLKGRADGKK